MAKENIIEASVGAVNWNHSQNRSNCRITTWHKTWDC